MKRRNKRRKGTFKKKSLYGIIFAIIILSIAFIYLLQHSPSITKTFQLKAAIVDHLSLSQPNQNFVQTATTTLEEAGYTVDYYPSEEITVEFYRNLPAYGYGLMVLRVHSALRDPAGRPLVLFTSQPYSNNKYIVEQLTDRIVPVAYTQEDFDRGEIYFGITPEFVQQDMKGTFKNTAIIMMGCNGLTYTEMAQAFIEKGAKTYISWSEAISSSHTDQATTYLLKHLVTGKQTIKQAVTETMKEVGADPKYGSTLQYYPDV